MFTVALMYIVASITYVFTLMQDVEKREKMKKVYGDDWVVKAYILAPAILAAKLGKQLSNLIKIKEL